MSPRRPVLDQLREVARAATRSYHPSQVLGLIRSSAAASSGRASAQERRGQPRSGRAAPAGVRQPARSETAVSSRIADGHAIAGRAWSRPRRAGREGRVARGGRGGRVRRVAPSALLARQGLPGKMFLLAFDPATGRLTGRSRLGAVLRAAALIELQHAGYLTDGGGRVRVVHAGSPTDPVLAEVLAEIRGSRPRKWRYWVDRRHGSTVRETRAELERNRLIRVERRRRFGVVPGYRLTLREPLVRRQLLAAAHDALRPARLVSRVDVADATLVVLAATADLRTVISKQQRKHHQNRLTQLADRIGPAAPALKKSLQRAAASSEAV